jgi:tRNA(Ile)-lysidine synthase
MTSLLTVVKSFLQPYLSRQPQVIVALSGGLDSRVLLDVLIRIRQELSFSLKAVHVHHGLSINADSWAEQCQHWCEEANVEFALERVSLDLKAGDSVESLARIARYNALSRHIKRQDILLTAQHNDDQVETFLLALKRGSGPKGLSSMAAEMDFHQGQLLRPLLTCSRASLHEYALARHLTWVDDESNQDTRFDRNFIRHHVTPILSQRWPHFSTSLQRSAELCAQQERLLDELLQERLEQALACDQSVSIVALASLSDAARSRLLRMWLARFVTQMPSQMQLTLIWLQVAQAQEDANPVMVLNQHEIRRFNQRLYCVSNVQPLTDWNATLTVNQPLVLPDNLGTITLFDAVTEGNGLALHRCVLDGELTVGFNSQGLRAHPQGKVGSKTLKKWYQEFGVPSWERRRTPILFCDGHVVAIANLFVDRHYCGKDCQLVWH